MSKEILNLISKINLPVLLASVLVLLVGYPIIYFIAKWIREYLSNRYTPQRGMIFGKVVQYGGTVLLIFTILKEVGFDLTPLLGAAGILGIAIGFASQTSVSNVICGIFLIIEESFLVDDTVQVDNIIGQVLSIDILSVKLRTFDNQYVRIPNEIMLKSRVINLTRFPIRRMELKFTLPLQKDMTQLNKQLTEIAYKDYRTLRQPEPFLDILNLTPTNIEIGFYVWCVREDYLELRKKVLDDFKTKLYITESEKASIEYNI